MVRSLALAPDGSLWAGHDQGRVSRFDGVKWTACPVASERPWAAIQAIAASDGGVIWFGTNDLGILRYEMNQP